MTMIDIIKVKCSVCGKTSEQPILLSTNSMGYSDLDTRPPEMRRSTMNTWVYECPHCGYVAGELEDELGIDEEFLKSDKYLTCDGFDFKGELSKRFFKNYLINNEKNNDMASFYNLLHCSWDCDDRNDENATAIRKLAVELLDRMIENGNDAKNNFTVIKSDLLRRSGEFDRVIDEYSDVHFNEELLDDIIRFQLEKASQKDSACYTIEDVVGPEV